MNINDFDYSLPEQLIAQYPLQNRRDSRLLVCNPNTQMITDSYFHEFSHFLRAGDLLVLNDTRVMPARIYTKKPTGGKVEILIERILENNQAIAHLGSNKALKTGQILILPDDSIAKILGRLGRLFTLQFDQDKSILDRLQHIGHIPLPPYLKRNDETADLARYQTVYARHQGSVAAPTAGLHFDQMLLDALKTKQIDHTYITLHVGAGTFMPVQVENIDQHVMHHEQLFLNEEACAKINVAKKNGNRIIAVGTTSLRCLESVAQKSLVSAQQMQTSLFIVPGFHFQIVDALITNFHLPKSTLLMLVSAFVGLDFCKQLYAHAINEQYRFYSYGDATLLFRQEQTS